VLVTAWVLVVVPLLLSLVAGAILLLPRMLASAWSSGHVIAGGIPHEVVHGQILALLAACLRLLALVLPLLGSVLIAQRLLRGALARLHRWSAGRPLRRVALVGVSCLAAAGAALAWWPSGQYQAIGARDRGTLLALGHALASPARIARPRPAAAPAVALPPGRYLAVAMIPKGGATKERPALLVIPGTTERPPVAILSPESPNFADTQPAGTGTASTGAATTSRAASGGTDAPVDAAAFPFKLPPKPGPGSTQAVAVGTRDGGVTYDIAYSLVTVSGGAPVTNTNSAFAFASCRACTTVAVSFQVVLVVGTSKVIAPIDAAGALNANCPACITVAVADQIVVTLKEQPTPDLVARITAALRRLDALRELGADASPAAIAAGVEAVQQQIDSALRDSGQLADPQTATTRTSTSPTTTASTVPTTPLSTTTAPTTTASSTTTAPPATVPTTTTAPSTTAPTTDPGTTTTESTTTAPATTAPTTTDESPTTTSPGG
jgi:putative peptide zinc metalloprotease protein